MHGCLRSSWQNQSKARAISAQGLVGSSLGPRVHPELLLRPLNPPWLWETSPQTPPTPNPAQGIEHSTEAHAPSSHPIPAQIMWAPNIQCLRPAGPPQPAHSLPPSLEAAVQLPRSLAGHSLFVSFGPWSHCQGAWNRAEGRGLAGSGELGLESWVMGGRQEGSAGSSRLPRVQRAVCACRGGGRKAHPGALFQGPQSEVLGLYGVIHWLLPWARAAVPFFNPPLPTAHTHPVSKAPACLPALSFQDFSITQAPRSGGSGST